MPKRIDREDVERLVAKGAQLLEVLGADEYREAHLPGAINIPLDELTRESANRLDRDRAVITYCYDTQCDMSPRAAWRLETLGFGPIYHYAPGKADWMGAGLPIEGEAAELPMVGAVARTEVATCRLATPVADLRTLLDQSEYDSCFVVNEERIVLGRVYRSRLEKRGARTAEDVMDPGPSTYRPDLPATELAERMREAELTNAPITTSDGRLIGLALRKDVEDVASRSPAIDLTDTNPAASHVLPRSEQR
jgi:rhodanese-related sulfurtransferase/CBS domain-containing protein